MNQKRINNDAQNIQKSIKNVIEMIHAKSLTKDSLYWVGGCKASPNPTDKVNLLA